MIGLKIKRILCAVFLFLLFFSGQIYASSESLVKVESRPGVAQKFILTKPDKPIAAVILFAGGHGGLRLSSLFGKPGMQWGSKNFLVRTRKLFADHGFMVAVIDAPPDRKKMNAIWRISQKHAQDILSVIRTLKKESDIPVWAVGTSMGTFSAPNAAIRLNSEVDGLVLTSTITRSPKKWKIYGSHPNGVIDMSLQNITVPTLIVSHRNDKCIITPASDSDSLKERFEKSKVVKVLLFNGGKQPISDSCNALSEHGFYGIEKEVVDSIAQFIKSN